MNILLDTQCWLWWIAEPEKLNEKARHLIADRNNDIFLSAASSWEIAIKYAIGKLALPEPPDRFVPPRLIRDGLSSLAVEHVHALRTADLPFHHRDPFDRLIIAQAQTENMPVMTADAAFRAYDVEIIPGGV